MWSISKEGVIAGGSGGVCVLQVVGLPRELMCV